MTSVPGPARDDGRDWAFPTWRPVMPDPHMRAGDTDRTAVATVLGRHMADGRLTVAEYDERVARAYAARTYADLAAPPAALPSADAGRSVAPVSHHQPAPVHGCGSV